MPQTTADLWQPLDGVWENLHKAETFIRRAKRETATPADISLDWCLEFACTGLWAALMIMNQEVLTLSNATTVTTKWFKANSPLVWKIRIAVEHYAYQYGVGQAFTPRQGAPGVHEDPDGSLWHSAGSREGEGDTVETFVWIRSRKGHNESIPLADALDELARTLELIRQIVRAETDVEWLKFHTEA